MLAIKKLNNNAVLCRDGQGRDVIAMGRGVGFGGEFPRELPLSKIEHTFYDIDPKGQDVMRDLPSEIVMFTAKVMDIVANELPYDLSTKATLFMADHLSFAVERAQKGFRIAMPLAYEVRETYPKEYKAAQFIVMRLEKELGERLPKEEIASIAMNLVNARVVQAIETASKPTKQFDDMLEDVTEIVESDFRIIVDRDSYDFTRYATHLRYLFKRIQAGESLNSANMQMYKNFREEFPQLAECVKHIGSYCRET